MPKKIQSKKGGLVGSTQPEPNFAQVCRFREVLHDIGSAKI